MINLSWAIGIAFKQGENYLGLVCRKIFPLLLSKITPILLCLRRNTADFTWKRSKVLPGEMISLFQQREW